MVIDAESAVVHAYDHEILAVPHVSHPVYVLVGCQRILVPSPVGEAERYVVGHLCVAWQECQIDIRMLVCVVGALPAQDVARAFEQCALESELRYVLAYLVGVNELCIAENLWGLSEERLDFLAVALDLSLELVLVIQRRERMCVRLAEKLHRTCVNKFLETVNHLRRILLQLLQKDSRNRECDLELTICVLYHLQQSPVRWQITVVCKIPHRVLVGKVIIVIMVRTNLEETVSFQS